MKNNFLILLLIFGLFIISGCRVVDDEPNVKPQEISINYSENDLKNVSLSINDLDITLDLSGNSYLKTLLLSIKLYKDNEYDSSVERTSKYVLSFNNYEFTIYDDETICYIDGEGEYDFLYTLNNEFKYLDTLYEKEILDFNKYTDSVSIKVFNSSNDSVEITEKNDFLSNLRQVKYFKLLNKEYYDLGNLKYKIQIDEEVINIYNKYIIINDNLYIVLDGDFTFLNNLKFSSSSGWLPWL